MKTTGNTNEAITKCAKNEPELIEIQKALRDDVMGQLVSVRKQKGLTQNDISVATGILRPNISRMENGNYNPTLDMIARIAYSLDKKIVISFEDIEE